MISFIFSPVFAIHIAKVDKDNKLNAIKIIDLKKSYFLVDNIPICFKYQINKIQKEHSEYDVCKKGFSSIHKSSASIKISKVNTLPLKIIFDHCNYEVLKLDEIPLSKRNEMFPGNKPMDILYERLISVKSEGLKAYINITGHLDGSVMNMPEGIISQQFIMKIW